MSPRNAAEIPIIDIGGLFGEAPAEAVTEIARQVSEACRRTGFFYIANHGVPAALIADAFAADRWIHGQTEDEKLKIKLNKWHRGYQPLATSTLKSSTRFEPAKYANQLESFIVRHEVEPSDPGYGIDALSGPNQWPDNSWFHDGVSRYSAAIRNLGYRLLPVFSVAVGAAPDFFGRFFAPASTALRMIHYPPAPAVRPDELYGIHPHTDYGFLTLLAQDEIGGLEVRHVDAGWIAAPYVPGTFVLNIGDILARWTNDVFNSTPHRVINRSPDRDRYSIAMFFDPNVDAAIDVLPSFSAADRAARYERIRYGDYYALRLNMNYPDRVGAA